MVLRLWTLVAVVEIGALACDDDTEAMPPATAMSPAVATAVAIAPTEATEFVAHLERLGEANDWATIQTLATEDFSAFRREVFVKAVRGEVIGSPYFTLADEWQLEADTVISLVTLKQPPQWQNFVLRKARDGSWRWDPGPWIHTWAEVWEHERNGPGLLGEGYDISFDSELIRDISIQSMTVIRVDVDGLFPEVTLEQDWTVDQDEVRPAGRLALDDISWETDSSTGGVEVTWANVRVTSEGMEFPERNYQGVPTYRFSVRLIDFPAGASVATLNFDEFVFDDGGKLRIRLSIPMRDYPAFDE